MMDFIKDIVQTLFRFVRFPCKTGVFTIGNPTPDAPVLVTCNFDYTVRHLKKYLIDKNIDCYLLVVNTNGTNVWCAAVEGIFPTENVLSYLKIYDVQKLINHNRLVLPQLAVAGIKRKVLEEHGWQGIFGPVYFKYLDEFLKNNLQKPTKAMKLLEYGYWERFKMGVSHGMFCTLVCGIPIVVFAFQWWWIGIVLVWYFALTMQLIEQFIPVRRLLYKGLILTIPPLVLLLFCRPANVSYLRTAMGVLALGTYIGFDSQGHSHMGQNQRSGKIALALLSIFALIYGGTFL